MASKLAFFPGLFRAYRRTDTPSYRDATAHLKTWHSRHSRVNAERSKRPLLLPRIHSCPPPCPICIDVITWKLFIYEESRKRVQNDKTVVKYYNINCNIIFHWCRNIWWLSHFSHDSLIPENKSVRTAMRLKWTFSDILGHFRTIRKTFWRVWTI